MTLHSGRLVGEVAATVPRAIETFGSAGIDCCRDARLTIAQVCLRIGVRSGRLISLLRQGAEGSESLRDWSKAPLGDLTRYVTGTYHPAETAAMERISSCLAAEQQERTTDLLLGDLRSAFAEVANNLMIHVWREENEVFPFVEDLERAHGETAPPPTAGAFPDPHDPILEGLRRLREMTRDYSCPAAPPSMPPILAELRAFDDMLHRHIHLESHVLYPRASALCACPLSAAEPAAVLTWF